MNTALAALVAAPAVRAARPVLWPRCSPHSWLSPWPPARWRRPGCGRRAPRAVAAGTRIAVVQPGVDRRHSGATRFERSEELTRQLAGQDVDLVVWGESSVGYDLASAPELRGRLAALSREVGARILVNVDARRSDRPGIFKSPRSWSARTARPATATTRCGWCPSASTSRPAPLLGWATSVGKAAGEDRLRGDGPVVMERRRTGCGSGRWSASSPRSPT